MNGLWLQHGLIVFKFKFILSIIDVWGLYEKVIQLCHLGSMLITVWSFVLSG